MQIIATSCAVRLNENVKESILTDSDTAISAQFNGWTHVQALGGRTPVTTSNQLATTLPTVKLEWAAVTLNQGTVSSYNIYRSTTSGGQDLSTPFATGISASTISYTDTTVTASTTYYYLIAPVVNGVVYFPQSTTDNEIKVLVPPTNMVLVHRWIANREICTLLGETPDRENNYRCSYIGPGKSTGDYYDLERSYFIDTVEAGCNYTRGTSCGGTVCLGTAAPGAGLGNNGDIYYLRDAGGSGSCYIKRAGAWFLTNTATDPEIASMYSNSPGLPPLVNVNQSQANAGCAQYTVNGQAKTLMSRKLQFAAFAYEESLTDTEINALEDGTGIYAANGCNTDNGHDGDFDAIAGNAAIPPNYETVAYTDAGNCYAYRTGSTSTAACVSRYGIQDHAGNINEWTSDQVNAGVGITSALVASNSDFNGIDFDNNESLNAPGYFYNLPEINLALGIPMAASAPSGWSTPLGSGTGEFPVLKTHGDYFDILTTGIRGSIVSGYWLNSTLAGRFVIYLGNLTTVRNKYIGFRCSVPAE